MCIPRSDNDEDCPQTNRPRAPNGQFLTQFVMDTVEIGVGTQFNGLPRETIPACANCNVTRMAPFVIGDFITYSAFLVREVITTVDGVLQSVWKNVAWAVEVPFLDFEAFHYHNEKKHILSKHVGKFGYLYKTW
jgi:hypothetical protein